MSLNEEGKIVQTELDEDEYARLQQVAEEQGHSLKSVLRRAAIEFVEREQRNDPGDPFFSGESPDIDDDGSELTATRTEEYLYE